ncbi:MAG: DUF3597 domain-containing protein [Rhodoblastus sp.]
MGFFGSIMSKIFGVTPAAAEEAKPAAPGAAPAAPIAPAGSVDVASILDGLVSKSGQELNWRVSIVDMMKALGLDSSLTARKELAKELHYEGDTSDSASMNIWLHKKMMEMIAANGGKLPDNIGKH